MNDKMIIINNLNFSYDDKVVFNKLNLSIDKGDFTTIIGSNGSGKSTLARIITGLISSENIYIDGILLCKDNLSFIRENMGIVLGYFSDSFICESVYDELIYSFLGLKKDVKKSVDSLVSSLGIEFLIDKNPNNLSYGEKQMVSIACALINDPNLIVLDEAFLSVDYVFKVKVLNYLKLLNEKKGITILNFTNDIDESLYGNSIVVIDNGNIILQDEKVSVFKQEKILKKAGFNLPFMVDLSQKLSYYDLVDDYIFDMDEMIDLLWK